MGLDLSSKMIELARGDEEESQLGVEYLVEDATAFMPEEQFDIVTAAYLLNYAGTEEKLFAMCKMVARCLKPGGRFVTVNNNPSQAPDRFEATRKYGFTKSAQEELRPGTAITYTIFQDGGVQDGGSFQFDNYYLSRAAHERALEASGLREIEWVEPKLSPECDSEPEYWNDFFVEPSDVLAGLSAIRDFDGVTGVISYDDESRIPRKSVSIIEVNGGSFRLVREWIPAGTAAP